MSLFQRLKFYAKIVYTWARKSVLFREVSSIQGYFPYKRVPLYNLCTFSIIGLLSPLVLLQVMVQSPDGAREAHLSDHTKRLYERFDPSRIRLLRNRNIRRGFEKEGMELQRPERIYDIPDVCLRDSAQRVEPRGSKTTPPKPRPVSTLMRPRLATPTTSTSDPTYMQAYQPLVLHTQIQPSSSTAPEPKKESPPPANTPPRSPARGGGQSPRGNRRTFTQLPLPRPNGGGKSPSGGGNSPRGGGREAELLLENRIEILEREVLALRAEIAKLRTLGQSTPTHNTPRITLLVLLLHKLVQHSVFYHSI